jgi:putative membrane protein
MKHSLFPTLFALLLADAALSSHTAAQTSRPVDPDTQFVHTQSADGLMVIKLSMVAVEKADTDDVKKFANAMIDNQATVNTELKQLATPRKVELATELAADHQREVQEVSQKYGRPFDRAYMVSLLKLKAQTLCRLEQQANEGKDPELRTWAGKVATTLREQIAQARQLAIKVGVEELDPKTAQSTASTR